MTDKDTLFQRRQRIGDFTFDRRVARVFDDMIGRSIPYYDEVQRMQAELVLDLLPEERSLTCDLGCSTGTTLAMLADHPRCPASARFHGIDNSAPMLEQAQAKLADRIEAGQVSLEETNLDGCPELPLSHVMLMNWTLQFVRPIHRESLIRTVHSRLHPGGALFLSEKVLVSDGLLNRLYIEHYLQYKAERGGYSHLEIQNKREALENVLVPYRIDEHHALLERCGFQSVDTYFRWFNFACMIAFRR
jgi:tRNA (cmo5U34)-methyltransferase